VALLVAFFVAWRLARATEIFALRQADSSLHAAARDLARAFHAHPSGYQTIEEAASPPDRPAAPRAEGPRTRPLPPHVKTLFAAYSDPLSRLTAITLHRYPETYGGFYQATDGALVGHAFPANAGTGSNMVLPSDIVDIIRALAKQVNETGAPATRTIQTGSDRIIVVAYPAQAVSPEVDDVSSRADGSLSSPIAAAWTMQRLSNLTGVSDKANLAALAVLILSIIAVSGLALITVRDLRSGVSGIEQGLTGLTNDLSQQITLPRTPELARITGAINQLADTLRVNLARQSELEHNLRRSERLSALGRLIAGVAHEVRNPLAAIKLKVQMARRAKNVPDNLDDTFRVITEEIDRLDALVRRLLELGRTQPLEQSKLDLCELVERRTALFNDVAERAGVKIESHVSPDPVLVEGDAERLTQVLDNLIQNALSAMPDGGRLAISCQVVTTVDGPAAARLTVEDTGRGIPPEDHERIFEPFFTARETGTGLGLAIAREIVEAHGGRINFVSREGSGALFLIELPQRVQAEDNKQFDQRASVNSGDAE
ncbi:MAG TPA: ATP-binding protein, partial [Pyrinomonadaceae bacterium]|nr:ATP-binding protein [Pyrinomonadaceae bacterium]